MVTIKKGLAHLIEREKQFPSTAEIFTYKGQPLFAGQLFPAWCNF